MTDLVLLPMDRRCLLEIARTGTTDRPWLARDLVDKGLVLPACHDKPGHVCTETTCDGHWRWVLTDQGRTIAALLDPTLDDWSLTGQMEIPL